MRFADCYWAVISWVLLWCATASAGDWPQILGPQRNGIAVDESLAESWPASGPASVWDVPVGSGFAGAAVQGETVVVFHRLGSEELVTALSAADGKPLWEHKSPCNYEASIVPDDGPRCVPTIHAGKVITFGVQGVLTCLDLRTGAKIWSRATHQDFRAKTGYFGAGSSPVVIDNRVIVNVGGVKGASVVAFDLTNGKTVWQKVDDEASYAAPIADVSGNQQRVLMITRLNFLGLDPANGKEFFRVPFGSRGPTVNGALPIRVGDNVLLTASYGIGAKLVDVTKSPGKVVWEDEILSSQYTTPIVSGGLIYGIDGRQDGGSVTLKCFDPATRKERWSKGGFDYATLIAAGDKLLVMETNGSLRLAALDPTAYRELAQANIHSGTTRALPALARGRLYVRNEQSLKCVELGAKP